LEQRQIVDVELIVDQARSLWRDASSRVSTARVELFAKASSRIRVARVLGGTGVTVDRTVESGLAVRVIGAGRDRAGFAASSGLAQDDARWATERAAAYGAQASAAEPAASAIESERWDLDDEAALPGEDMLTGALHDRLHVSWIEAGTTLEVLVGTSGWIAARRRQRIWALADVSGPQLFAQRGFGGWDARIDARDEETSRVDRAGVAPGRTVILSPHAAAPVVAALVDAFHREGVEPRGALGAGWGVADEPVRPDALVGGAFDDAGFPAARRVLADDGLWVGALAGPGTYRRSSFRDPPVEAASNLVMAGGQRGIALAGAANVSRSRVIRISPELWVLELELAGGLRSSEVTRNWIRTSPAALIGCCRSRLGGATLTPDGPIVPFLVFEGLSAR